MHFGVAQPKALGCAGADVMFREVGVSIDERMR
jgi:hypothetical protein